jgi:hypothetical protein
VEVGTETGFIVNIDSNGLQSRLAAFGALFDKNTCHLRERAPRSPEIHERKTRVRKHFFGWHGFTSNWREFGTLIVG